jgi:type II secretory pathway component PulF
MNDNEQNDILDNNHDLVFNIKNQEEKFKDNSKFKFTTFREFYDFINEWVIDRSPVALEDKLVFFQLLGSMNNAGISILESLKILEGQTKNAKLQHIIKDIHDLIRDGESLANAMRQNSDLFNEATCAVIEAGEKSGKLNEVMKELVEQYEQMSGATKKLKSVMLYPMIVMVVMAILSVAVVVFVIPKLADLFGGSANLPLPTRILMWMSDFVIEKWWLLIIIVLGSSSLFLWWKKTKGGHRAWATFLLNIPIAGGLLKLMILSRVTRIFGFLIASGVPIVKSLRIAADVAENPVYQEKLLLTSDDLTKGIPIAENLADDEKLFPNMLVSMIAIGERTASLEKIMGKIATFYSDEFNGKIGNLSKIMEPIIMFIVAGGALFLILAIFMPIMQMNDHIVG